MKHRKIGAVLLALAISTSVPAISAEKLEGFENIQQTSVRVIVKNIDGSYDYGTGWVIETGTPDKKAGNGTIATALHVVGDAAEIVIKESGDASPRVAVVKYTDRARDLAFLEVKDLRTKALTLTTKQPHAGAPGGLTATGYTAASDRQDKTGAAQTAQVKSGTLSRPFRGPGDIDMIEHDIALNPGYSGGPVVDACGRVVAVNLNDGGHITLRDGRAISLSQGVGSGVATNELIKFANESQLQISTDNSECKAKDTAPVLDCTQAANAKAPQCIATNPNAMWYDKFLEFMKSTKGIAALIALLGLGGAGTALYFVLRPKGGSGGSAEPIIEEPIAPPSSSSRMTLSGSGPAGEPISLSFNASDLAGSGKLIGREGSGGIVPDNRPKPMVSREHAKVSHDGKVFQIADFKSVNKTYLNDRALGSSEVANLRDGDVIRLYDVKLHVRID